MLVSWAACQISEIEKKHKVKPNVTAWLYIDGLALDCGNSGASALEFQHSCTKSTNDKIF